MATNRIYYGDGRCKENKVENLELHKDEYGYYLSIKFLVENDHSIREVVVPKIRLPIATHNITLTREFDHFINHEFARIDLGFGELNLDHEVVDGMDILFKETVLKEKYTEMTIEDIEKKLGYKVKIVGERSNK
jgi:hypothetical protein